MPPRTVRANPSLIYRQADQFRDALETRQVAAADQMLAAWTEAYWAVRQDLDTLLAKIDAARASGETVGPSWLYRQQRLSAILGTVTRQVGNYATAASASTQQAQAAAIRASAADAIALVRTAADPLSTAGIRAEFVDVEPDALVETLAGFTGADGVLATHLRETLTPEAVDQVRSTLLHGITTGKGTDWMARRVTKNLAMTHSRAVTIMRTESLRVYRETARRTYEANPETVTTWVWKAHRDSACCIACVVMDGTEHPTSAILDGHPRCRCAMIPRTPSWEDLGITGLPDTRPPLDPGKAWLEAQPESVQRALMGGLKYDAWKAGQITLDDMVARKTSPTWGTMRTERPMVAIKAGRDANWMDDKAA